MYLIYSIKLLADYNSLFSQKQQSLKPHFIVHTSAQRKEVNIYVLSVAIFNSTISVQPQAFCNLLTSLSYTTSKGLSLNHLLKNISCTFPERRCFNDSTLHTPAVSLIPNQISHLVNYLWKSYETNTQNIAVIYLTPFILYYSDCAGVLKWRWNVQTAKLASYIHNCGKVY